MERIFKDLIEFEEARGHKLSKEGPAIPGERTWALRKRLIEEEYTELMDAMSVWDLPEITDGILDLIYVLAGTAVEFGIDLTPLWPLVHQANMEKFGPGSWKDEMGKTQKPDGWRHPDIAAMLQQQPSLACSYKKLEVKGISPCLSSAENSESEL